MEIIVEIREGENGRPVGTVRLRNADEAIPFTGNLEFMALIERLYRVPNIPNIPHDVPASGQ